ncbi:dicarboxylate/amino acid:cation symporter [Olivibacter sp. SDN3]|uniref:dicarboxylate/amino acid:cation symporter n=1 Tax=Olivibacter sp. SDN3 TaxID=2764720 RepID=UPI00165120E5|nr:dicarboxylate/amino acid:cation symporter [Olivibacter sp. SDN3]QNL47998.1 dicarboxylate/amino acid:cation symporter [Olivibacter sp. SDN3]
MRKIALHLKILLGILFGIIIGIVLTQFSWGTTFVINWIKPFGTIFINLLKLIAIPLIVTSLITGLANLKDIAQLSKMGSRTFVIYISTTLLALTVGLLVVNTVRPGNFISTETRNEMLASFEGSVGEKVREAEAVKAKGPLQPLVDIVPENIFEAAGSNTNMLQIILFTILCGVSLLLISPEKSAPVVAFFQGANAAVLKLVDIIMKTAPIGVFALMASLVAESPSADIFLALGMYGLSVVIGLAMLMYIAYSMIIYFMGGLNAIEFFRKIIPAKLVAFSTSSSAATLPVTMECVEDRLGVDKEVSSFVIPIGATINMDGTVLYQSVAAVFIAQVMGYELTLANQLTIVFTATLASIGAAPVPGAGILMLVIVLESIGVNPAGLALIFAVDRPLDMCRTVVNVTGDAMICVVVNKQMGHTLKPKVFA